MMKKILIFLALGVTAFLVYKNWDKCKLLFSFLNKPKQTENQSVEQITINEQ